MMSTDRGIIVIYFFSVKHVLPSAKTNREILIERIKINTIFFLSSTLYLYHPQEIVLALYHLAVS